MSPPNPRKGRGTHLRLPLAPALGPTSPSLHKAGPEAGARPAGRLPGRDWTQARRPAAPAALPRRVSSSRPGRGGRAPRLALGGPGSRAPLLFRRQSPGEARRTRAVPLATPEVVASSARRPGRRGGGGRPGAGVTP